MTGEHEKKVVVVTGAGQGIGRGLVRAFHGSGALVALLDIQAHTALQAAADLDPAAQTARAWEVDVGNHSQVEDVFGQVVHYWGAISVLVNNAGIQLNCPSLDLEAADLRRVLDINLLGAFYCSQAAARLSMVPQRQGVIISLSSITTRISLPRRLPYTIAKTGIEAMTRVLAAEWAPHNIRVNAVAPGYIRTQLVEDAARWGHIDLQAILDKTPAGHLGEIEDVVELVVFLASDRARFITGQVIFVDGGYTLSK